MRNILNQIKFRLTATNQHGVHSPFIYAYVTKCLYAKKKYSHIKSKNILLKSIAYFGAERVYLPPENENIRNVIQHEFLSVKFQDGPYDILFTGIRDAEALLQKTSEENAIHNNTVLLIDTINGDAAATSLWENIKVHPKVRVTVDLFYCGAVFFRKEQAKEHFKIRT
ncbi:MAG: hypothetical protein WBG48_01770 [Pricia sp.]